MSKEKIKDYHKIKLPKWITWYILFLLVVIFWHILIREYYGDAISTFSKGLDSDTLIDILEERYNTWSSRVFVEALLYPLSRNITLWKICNIAIYALLGYSLLRLTNFKHPRLTLGLIIIYPIIEMASAGWIATYMNYLWPAAFIMYAMTGLQKIYNNEKIHLLRGGCLLLAVLIATNVEQVGVLYICILIIFGVDNYIIKRNKKSILFYIFQWIITLGNLIFILLSPGSSIRSWKEIANWMHDFGTMSIIDKGVLGVSVTMNKLVTGNLNFLIFVSLIFIVGMINQHYTDKKVNKSKNIFIQVCYTTPCIFTSALTILKNSSSIYFTKIQGLFADIEKVDATNWNNFKYYIPFIIYMYMILAIIVSLLNLFDNFEINFILAAIFLTGLLTRVIMGFSPTLYASNMRTFIFFDVLIMLCIVIVYDYSEGIRCKIPKQVHKVISYIFSAIVVMSIINNTIAICDRV